jgi:hypothetical protein
MDGQWQDFATPEIPKHSGAIAKRHATRPVIMHNYRMDTVLFETGFGSVVLHAA